MELLSSRGQPDARLIADEERSIQLLFETVDARAYRRLGQVQVRSGGDEAPDLQDLQERTGGGDIHGSIFLPFIGNSILFCLFYQSTNYNPTRLHWDVTDDDK